MSSGRLEKDLGASEDLLARLVARNKIGQFTELVERVANVHTELESFLKELRVFLAEIGMLISSDHIDHETTMKADQMIRCASCHQKCMADLLKEMRAAK
jgi:hypothetical protein